MGKKVCVVGAGYWGKNHLTTLSQPWIALWYCRCK